MAEIVTHAADRNKHPILEVLKEYIASTGRLLEIGSGNGIHAIFFAEHFKNLHWITSDISENHAIIQKRLREKKLANIHGPEKMKIGTDDFPKRPFDYVFTANTLQVMSWKESRTLFKILGKRLREGSLVFIYGPFNYGGKFVSEGNQQLDKKLKQMNPKSGIRNFEDVMQSMEKAGFKLIKDHQMPVNNHLLVFERLPFSAK